jgi:hypothetical protein
MSPSTTIQRRRTPIFAALHAPCISTRNLQTPLAYVLVRKEGDKTSSKAKEYTIESRKKQNKERKT